MMLEEINITIGRMEHLGDRDAWYCLDSILAPQLAFRRANGSFDNRCEFLTKVNPSEPRDTEIVSIDLHGDRAFARLGAIGPDLLFYAADYPFIKALLPGFRVFGTFKDTYETTMEPIEDLKNEIKDAVNDSLDQLEQLPVVGTTVRDIRDLVETIQRIKDQFDAIEKQVYEVLIVSSLGLSVPELPHSKLGRSIFQGIFEPGIQAGLEEQDWFWFDMLHYRRTGQFARKLLENAGNDTELRAYALGYLTHIATDVVGHPYVNMICGAPYRIGVQRHIVVENYMDQWAWNHYRNGQNIRSTLYTALGFDSIQELPDKLASLIVTALQQTFQDVAHPLRMRPDGASIPPAPTDGFPAPQDIKDAYALLRATLALLGDNTDLRPQPPYPGADEDLTTLASASDLFSPPPELAPPPGYGSWSDYFLDPGDPFSVLMRNDPNLWFDWFAQAQNLIEWAANSAGQALDLIVDSVANPVGGTPTRFLLVLLYKAEQEIYNIYRMLNTMLALAGLTYPEPDEVLLSSPLAARLITPIACELDGKDCGYPRLRHPDQSHLVCPSCLQMENSKLAQSLIDNNIQACFEMPETKPAFYPRTSLTTPTVFINDIPLDESALINYAQAQNPAATRGLYGDHGPSIGNARDFSVWMISRAMDTAAANLQNVVFCDWNLDGDRGYAYKCWDGIVPLCRIDVMEQAVRLETVDFAQQFPRVWTDASGIYSPPEGMDRYLPDKTFADSMLTSLNISEFTIPSRFRRLRVLTPNEWAALVPQRLRLDSDLGRCNIRFVNGATTIPHAGIRSSGALERTLREALVLIPVVPSNVRVKLIHNRTSLE